MNKQEPVNIYVVSYTEDPDDSDTTSLFGAWTDYNTAQKIADALGGEVIPTTLNREVGTENMLYNYRVDVEVTRDDKHGRLGEVVLVEKGESTLAEAITDTYVGYVGRNYNRAADNRLTATVELSVLAKSVTEAMTMVADYLRTNTDNLV